MMPPLPLTPALIDAETLERAGRALAGRRTRLVAWGSGSVYDYFQSLHPIAYEYIVDNDAARWGEVRDGIPVVPPSRLQAEDPRYTLIVICSGAWPDIRADIQRLGEIPSVPASALFADDAARTRLAWCERVATQRSAARKPASHNTVVVQGPVIPGVTARVLGAMTALHPGDLVLLSTWDDTPRELLDEAVALADDVVLSARPRTPGIQNRNCQLASTSTGVRRAIECGADTILKVRTDIAVLSPDIFDQARWWLDLVGSEAARAAGLKERLIVPSSFTRKFLLYHPSDLVMIGAAEDMQRYWSAAADDRTGSLLSPDWLDLPLVDVGMSGNPAESYLGLQLCRTLGRSVQGTVADSWTFYRDLFSVMDDAWFDMLWFKHLAIPDGALRAGPRQLVTQRFWQQLQTRAVDMSTAAAEVDLGTTSLRALAGAAGRSL